MTRIRLMTVADVPHGMRLKGQAGWNQLEADWLRLLAMQPDGCFLAEHEGVPVGTVVTCVFGSVAWIAMMLVDEQLRGRGIGRALMDHAIGFLNQPTIRTVRLDATPLGQPLYERLGFVPEYQLTRFAGRVSGDIPEKALSATSHCESPSRDSIAALADFDLAVTATDRRKLLSRLFEENAERIRVIDRDGRIRGYLASRPGIHATQIGPCIADAEAGPLLFRDVLSRYRGEAVYIDIPTANRPAVQLAESCGLTPQRLLLRMRLGEPVADRVDLLWAGSGPEKG